MVKINDFNENTTSYELFFFLYVKLIKKEITTFDQIVSLTEKIPLSNTKEHALKNAFYLLRRLNWGFFNQLSPDEYPKLWKKTDNSKSGVSICRRLKKKHDYYQYLYQLY